MIVHWEGKLFKSEEEQLIHLGCFLSSATGFLYLLGLVT